MLSFGCVWVWVDGVLTLYGPLWPYVGPVLAPWFRANKALLTAMHAWWMAVRWGEKWRENRREGERQSRRGRNEGLPDHPGMSLRALEGVSLRPQALSDSSGRFTIGPMRNVVKPRAWPHWREDLFGGRGRMCVCAWLPFANLLIYTQVSTNQCKFIYSVSISLLVHFYVLNMNFRCTWEQYSEL